MSKLGDVVFCVDCDRTRSENLRPSVGDSAGTPQAQPRRMATKKDANGEALCAACLDARLQRRRVAFLQPRGNGEDPNAESDASSVGRPTEAVRRAPASTKPIDMSKRRFSGVRIERTRPSVKSVAKRRNRSRVIAEVLADQRRTVARTSSKEASSRNSLQLAALEIGLRRAHELLAEIRAVARTVVGRTR